MSLESRLFVRRINGRLELFYRFEDGSVIRIINSQERAIDPDAIVKAKVLENYVPITRKVNGIPLTDNIEIGGVLEFDNELGAFRA